MHLQRDRRVQNNLHLPQLQLYHLAAWLHGHHPCARQGVHHGGAQQSRDRNLLAAMRQQCRFHLIALHIPQGLLLSSRQRHEIPPCL